MFKIHLFSSLVNRNKVGFGRAFVKIHREILKTPQNNGIFLEKKQNLSKSQ